MAEITRTEASEMQITAFNQNIFGYRLIFPSGAKLKIKSVELISHLVDGTRSKNASPVFQCEHANGGEKATIYINALIKRRYDYMGKPIQPKGTLNLEVQKLIGLTGAKVMESLQKFVGCEIEAIEICYKGIDRTGDVRDISYNEYDFITMPTEKPETDSQPETADKSKRNNKPKANN